MKFVPEQKNDGLVLDSTYNDGVRLDDRKNEGTVMGAGLHDSAQLFHLL